MTALHAKNSTRAHTYKKIDHIKNTKLNKVISQPQRIRLAFVKTLGKETLTTNDVQNLVKLFQLEENSNVKREIVSTIGRQRNKENIDVLIKLSYDPDPKIVLQTIRALFYMRQNNEAWKRIISLHNHKNELVREFISNQIQSDSSTSNTHPEHGDTDNLENKIIHGDTLKNLRLINENVIDLTFTSPPYYNARDYATYNSYSEYLDFLEMVFREVYRITAEGRFFVLNTSPVIIPRTSRQTASKRYAIPFDMHTRLVNIGFEFIDDIIWKKPAPSARNRNGGFYQHRKPLGYKPNSIVEYVMVYRKKTNKLLDWNMKQYDKDIIERSKIHGDYEHTNVWEIGASTNKIHPAIFPKKLADSIIKLYSYVNDLVLDPFAGIGTVGLSCIDNNRKYLLVERELKYVKEMRRWLL